MISPSDRRAAVRVAVVLSLFRHEGAWRVGLRRGWGQWLALVERASLVRVFTRPGEQAVFPDLDI